MEIPVLSDEVSAILRTEAFSALKSLPRRGAEIGGFLTASESSGALVDGVELITSEHLYGPFFRLSPSDVLQFKQKLKDAEGRRVVGYFRSCTREQCLVEAADLALIKELLPGTEYVFLVQPSHSGSAAVQVYSIDAHGETSHAAAIELPMSLAVPLPAAREEASGPRAEEETLMTWTVPQKASPWQRVGTGLGQGRGGWLAGAVLILLGAAAILWSNSGRSNAGARASGPPEDLGMRVETDGNSMRVSWDRNLPAAQSAVAGELWIDDGKKQNEVKLSRSQIATGSFLYATDANDVTFRMRLVETKGFQPAETVRLIKERPATVSAALKQVKSVEPAPAAPLARTNLRAARKEGEPLMPIMRAWPSSPARASYRPALPVRRIAPSIESSLVTRPEIIEVGVKIDEKGRVVEAHQMGKISKSGSPLPREALQASRKWIFEPAKSRGQSVASDYNIVYRFSPPR